MTKENCGPNPTQNSGSQVEISDFHFCQAVMKCPNPLPSSPYRKYGVRGSLVESQDFDGNLVMRPDTIHPMPVVSVQSTWGAVLNPSYPSLVGRYQWRYNEKLELPSPPISNENQPQLRYQQRLRRS